MITYLAACMMVTFLDYTFAHWQGLYIIKGVGIVNVTVRIAFVAFCQYFSVSKHQKIQFL